MTAALTGVMGTVYLIHFEEPYKHAQHYLGWASNLDGRLRHHRKGTGGNLMRIVTRAGIAWRVVRTWDGDRHLERRIKNIGGLARCCPVCGGTRGQFKEEK